MPVGSTAHAQTGDSRPDISRRRRLAMALIAAGWCAVLACLVLTTANPVTLNRRQVLDADAVVTVQVADLNTGACRIVKQWTGTPLSAEIVVARLNETAVHSRGDWILPLAKTAHGWEVLPSLLPSGARLVYPATPEATAQLEAILGENQRQ